MRPISEKLRIVNDYIESAQPPVQVVPLASKLGVRVFNSPWPNDVSGRIERNEVMGGESGFAIFVNETHPTVRRRFTIAHEIAHYVLHEDKIGDGVFDDALYRSGLPHRVEVQANSLAADILMPRKYIDQFRELLGDDVALLAAEFDVSKHAMSIRLGVPYFD